MLQLRVHVKRLNKRRQIPVHFPDRDNIIGEVFEGFVFEGEEVAIVPNPNLGKWYKDRDGFFYWGGGVTELIIVTSPVPPAIQPPEGVLQFDSNKMSWAHKFYDIPFIWNDLKTKGKGVTVAVIDTGVDDKHPDLISNIHSLSKSLIGSEKDILDIDGHGTQMAGIIAASGHSKVFGVAPEAKILIVRAATEVRGVDIKLFAKALNHAATINEVDIISVSNCFFIDDRDLQNAVTNCLENNKIIVAAIGNGRDFIGKPNGPDEDTFPACYANVIGVGAFDQQGRICTFSNWNSHLDFLSPGDFSVLTTGINNNSAQGAGTSIATAFTAGCLALLLSFAKTNAISPEKCIQSILDSCDDIGVVIGKDLQSGNGRMNLRNAINKLK